MSGIPIYTQSPINAAKASGATPQTSAPPTYSNPAAPTSTPATTTAAATSTYPAARPGASVPAPTGTTRYAPTSTQENNGPPPPQPGAVPTAAKSSLPPPPKAGQPYQSYQAPQVAAPAPPMPVPYPAQMGIPPPTNPYAFGAQPPTATSNTPSSAYPALIQDNAANARESIEHPPGYQQNAYASELTNDQRRAQEASNASSGFGRGDDSAGGLDAGSIWDSAKKWAQTAGEKLSEGEKEVWRKINKE